MCLIKMLKNSQGRKKKKSVINISFSDYLDEEEVDMEEDNHAELSWFTKKYLNNDLGINSKEASEIFWKDRKSKYPSVIMLLCKYRSVACTSIYEEQCFSTINKIVTDDRSSFKDETVESMMFLKKNHGYFNIQ